MQLVFFSSFFLLSISLFLSFSLLFSFCLSFFFFLLSFSLSFSLYFALSPSLALSPPFFFLSLLSPLSSPPRSSFAAIRKNDFSSEQASSSSKGEKVDGAEKVESKLRRFFSFSSDVFFSFVFARSLAPQNPCQSGCNTFCSLSFSLRPHSQREKKERGIERKKRMKEREREKE